MHTTYLQLMQLLLLQLAVAALIAADGTSRDDRPPGHGKTTCGNNEDAFKVFE